MKRIFKVLLILTIPNIAIASDFSGFAQLLFTIYVLCPLLALESLVIIFLALSNKFENKSRVAKANGITIIILLIGLLTILSYISVRSFNGDVIWLIIVLMISGCIALLLPNIQFWFNKKR